MTRTRWMPALILASVAGPFALSVRAAEPPGLAEARRLAARGELAAAEAAYDRLLAAGAGAEARRGRAFVRSHRGEQAGAQADFRAALAADPGDVAALVGLGYSLAWNGEHEEAARRLEQALSIVPGQPDAEKGLAYVALWRGNHAEAAGRFGALAAGNPRDAEPLVGLGRALAAGGDRAEARRTLSRALAIDPANDDARNALAETAPAGLRAELTLLGGVSSFAERSEVGVRFAELAVLPGEATRLWIQYDDSLSLDAAALARDGVRAPAGWLGARAAWTESLATRLEVGLRRLPGGVDEWLLRGEQEAAVGRGVSLRMGGWLGLRDDERVESVVHAGAAIPAGRVRLEPAVFLARSGVAGEREVRFLAAAEVDLAPGFTFASGLSVGRTTSPSPGADGTPLGAFARFAFPLGRGLRGQALVTQERPAAGSRTTVYALGVTAALGGNR